MNPIQIARGIEKTAVALVSELKLMSREVTEFFFPNFVEVLKPLEILSLDIIDNQKKK